MGSVYSVTAHLWYPGRLVKISMICVCIIRILKAQNHTSLSLSSFLHIQQNVQMWVRDSEIWFKLLRFWWKLQKLIILSDVLPFVSFSGKVKLKSLFKCLSPQASMSAFFLIEDSNSFEELLESSGKKNLQKALACHKNNSRYQTSIPNGLPLL